MLEEIKFKVVMRGYNKRCRKEIGKIIELKGELECH